MCFSLVKSLVVPSHVDCTVNCPKQQSKYGSEMCWRVQLGESDNMPWVLAKASFPEMVSSDKILLSPTQSSGSSKINVHKKMFFYLTYMSTTYIKEIFKFVQILSYKTTLIIIRIIVF